MRETPAVMIPVHAFAATRTEIRTQEDRRVCECGGVRPELGEEVRRSEQQDGEVGDKVQVGAARSPPQWPPRSA